MEACKFWRFEDMSGPRPASIPIPGGVHARTSPGSLVGPPLPGRGGDPTDPGRTR